MTAEFEGCRRDGGLSPVTVFTEIGDGSENVNNRIGNALVIPLLTWNGESIKAKEGYQNGLNVQESKYVRNEVGRWLK